MAASDRSLRVGVSFLGVHPQMGGFYQLSLSVLEALVDADENYELVLFTDDPAVLDQHDHLRENVRVVRVPKERPSFVRNVFRILAAIWGPGPFPDILKGRYAALDAERCDVIVHPHWGVGSYVTSAPAISTVVDSAPKDQPGLMPRWAGLKLDLTIRAIVRRARIVVAESDWGGVLLQTHYNANPAKIRVLPLTPPKYLAKDGSPEMDAEILASLAINEGYLFLPGRWDNYKNTKRVLAALAMLRDAGHAVPLLVLSGLKTHELEPARLEIALHGLTGRVLVAGYVPDSAMSALYRNAIALVFPTTLGPTSLPVVEAISLGCPVIVPNIPSYPAQAGEAGIVVDPYDVASIAKGIESVVFDAECRERLRRSAVARAEEIRAVDYGERLGGFIRDALRSA